MIQMVTDTKDMYVRIARNYINMTAQDRENESFIYRYMEKGIDNIADIISGCISEAAEKEDIIDICGYAEKKGSNQEEYKEQLARYIGGSKKDKCAFLKAAYAAYTDSIISRQEYIIILSLLADEKTDKKFITQEMPEEKIAELQGKYEKKLIRAIIKENLYNNGISVNTDDGTVKDSPKAAKYRSEGYTDDLEIWVSLYEYESVSGNKSAVPVEENKLTDEYMAECAQVYEKIKTCRNDSYVVPLYFDKRTGAGVYILGAFNLVSKDGNVESTYSDGYYVCVICFNEAVGGYFCDEHYETGIQFEGLDVTMEIKVFDNTKDAFEYFRNNNTGFIGNYCDLNGVIPDELKDKISDNFRVFFKMKKDAPLKVEIVRTNSIDLNVSTRRGEKVKTNEDRYLTTKKKEQSSSDSFFNI